MPIKCQIYIYTHIYIYYDFKSKVSCPFSREHGGIDAKHDDLIYPTSSYSHS